MRIDKYLWTVRLFKTRTQATDAIKSGKVSMNNQLVKPGAILKTGDVFILKSGSMRFTYKVVAFPKSRINNKLVPEYIENITNPDDQKRNEIIIQNKKNNNFLNEGRPTKKNRRTIDKWMNND